MTTNAQLTQQINDLLSAWNQREAQFRAWLAGTPNGGPNGDGKYPLTDAAGVTQLVDSPAKLADTVGGPAGDAAAAQALAEAARDTTVTAKDRAVTAETVITGLHSEVITNRNLALLYRNDAAAYAAQLSIGRDQAVAAKTAAEAARDAALISETNAAASEDNALASANAAAASALQAATFNPADYYTKVASDARYKAIGYVPAWGEITSKPVSFPPSAHTHVIADVTGLQAALDGKQAAGSYASAVHGHVIADVTGLQAALDGKQAAGSYAAAAHTHVIADVTGLQTALDGKQPTGSYLTGITGTMVTTALGYTPYNSSNPAGYISGITSGMVTTALGYAPANKAGDTFTGAITINSGSHQAVIAADGAIELTRSGGGAYIDLKDSTAEDFDVRLQASGNALGISATGGLTLNGAAVLTGITSGMVTTALGYTPANKAGDTFTGQLSADVGGGAASASFALRAVNGGYFVGTFARGSAGAYNSLVQANDAAMIFSAGSAGTGALFIGPWSGSLVGLRMDASGNTTVTGSLTSSGLLTVSGAGLSAAVRLSNTTGGRDLRVMQKDDGRFVITDETAGAERLAINASGNVTAMVDFRSPTFYDSNNTGYYVDPASTSVINGLNVANNTPVYSSGSFQYHQYQSPHVAYVKKTGGYSWYWRRNDTGLAGGANEVEDMSLTEAGNLFARSSVRAPVFYDSNDTSYYVDPNGITRLDRLEVVTETTYPGSINNDYASGYYHFSDTQNTPTGSYGHAHIIRLSADWNVQMFFPTSNTNEPMWLRRKQAGTYSAWRRLLQENEWIGGKYFSSDGQIYGTIFYDSNNGAYYCDPSGTSVLSDIRATTGISAYDGGVVGSDAYGMISATRRSDGNYSYFGLTRAGQLGMGMGIDTSNQFWIGGTTAGFNGTRSSWWLLTNTSGDVFASNSFRAPVFYDNNNTGYYLDPAGENVLNTLTLMGELNLSASGINYIDHSGTIYFRNQSGYATSATLTTGGDFTASGNVSAYSDARLKENVETVENALDLVSAMRGVTYTRKDTGLESVGVIAQEMIEVVPQVVQHGEDGTLSVAYGNLVGVLIEAIKELRAEVEALKNA